MALIQGGFEQVAKNEIVKAISDRTGFTQRQIKEILRLTFEAIITNLAVDGRVELRRFGVFELRQRKARICKNPTTGEILQIPERSVVVFKASSEMEHRVIGQIRPDSSSPGSRTKKNSAKKELEKD